MDDWIGFTDEELRRLKGQNAAQKRGSGGRSSSTRGHAVQKARPRQLAQKVATSPRPETADIKPSMVLSQPKSPADTECTNVAKESDEKVMKEKKMSNDSTSPEAERKEDPMPDPEKVLGKELDEKEFVQRELSNVDKFQIQQKIMEEQNKKKQELLALAIVERQKKAKAEASKLVRIQRELATLDRILHADVTIIRDKIEEASREFLEAQKRYDRAEQEFVEAKMDLHRKSEIKDSLTEHLYTIIHQNEIRKAKKLTELMEKLQLEGGEEASPVHIDLSGLPSMTLLNAIHTLEPSSPTSAPTSPNAQQQTANETRIVFQGQNNEPTMSPTSGHTTETNSKPPLPVEPGRHPADEPLANTDTSPDKTDGLGNTVSDKKLNSGNEEKSFKSDKQNSIKTSSVKGKNTITDHTDQNENVASHLQNS